MLFSVTTDTMLLDRLEEDLLLNQSIRVFPVPAESQLTVEIDKDYFQTRPQALRLEISDITGKSKIQEIFTLKTEIDLTGFPPGIYLLSIIQEQKRFIKKIIVQ